MADSISCSEGVGERLNIVNTADTPVVKAEMSQLDLEEILFFDRGTKFKRTDYVPHSVSGRPASDMTVPLINTGTNITIEKPLELSGLSSISGFTDALTNEEDGLVTIKGEKITGRFDDYFKRVSIDVPKISGESVATAESVVRFADSTPCTINGEGSVKPITIIPNKKKVNDVSIGELGQEHTIIKKLRNQGYEVRFDSMTERFNLFNFKKGTVVDQKTIKSLNEGLNINLEESLLKRLATYEICNIQTSRADLNNSKVKARLRNLGALSDECISVNVVSDNLGELNEGSISPEVAESEVMKAETKIESGAKTETKTDVKSEVTKEAKVETKIETPKSEVAKETEGFWKKSWKTIKENPGKTAAVAAAVIAAGIGIGYIVKRNKKEESEPSENQLYTTA